MVTSTPQYDTFLHWLGDVIEEAGWQVGIDPKTRCYCAVWLSRLAVIHLTCRPDSHNDQKCSQHAHDVVAALRRVYGQSPQLRLD